MKKLYLAPFLLGVALTASAQDKHYSPGIADIVKLAQAKAGPAVIESFINNSDIPYSPSSDEIIYLRSQGISDEVLSALLKHGAEMRRQAMAAAGAPPYPGQGAPPPGAPPPPSSPPDPNQPAAQGQPMQPPPGAPPPPSGPPPQGTVPMPNSPAPSVPGGQVPPPAPDGAAVPGGTTVVAAPAVTYVDGYYWGPGYWGWSGGAYVWFGPGWRWGGWGRGYGWHGGYGYHGGWHGGGHGGHR